VRGLGAVERVAKVGPQELAADAEQPDDALVDAADEQRQQEEREDETDGEVGVIRDQRDHPPR
jgi:hypothetical protein